MKNSISVKKIQQILKINFKNLQDFKINELIDFDESENLCETVVYRKGVFWFLIQDNRLELSNYIYDCLIYQGVNFNGFLEDKRSSTIILEYSSDNWLKDLKNDINKIIKKY